MRRENPKRTLIAEKQLPVDGTKFKSLEELVLFIEKEAQKRYEDIMKNDASKMKF